MFNRTRATETFSPSTVPSRGAPSASPTSQGGDSIALKCAGGNDGGDVLVLGGVGGDD